jgi:ketosteroid isomerase-like protein
VRLRSFIWGAIAALGLRTLSVQLLKVKFNGDVAKLNNGDYNSLLSVYGEDFVLHFNEGPHRWSGDWHGRSGMERFLQIFTSAGVHGEIKRIAVSGPPWAMTLWVRFDDHADAADGTRLYENQTVLVLRTRFGKIVEQHDFYTDTTRIVEFDRKLAAAAGG